MTLAGVVSAASVALVALDTLDALVAFLIWTNAGVVAFVALVALEALAESEELVVFGMQDVVLSAQTLLYTGLVGGIEISLYLQSSLRST